MAFSGSFAYTALPKELLDILNDNFCEESKANFEISLDLR